MIDNKSKYLVGGGKLESDTISILRFPMAVMILLLHSSFMHELNKGISIFEGWSQPIYRTLDAIFVGNITNIAVPLFFMVSGYLFFLKNESFTFEDYKGKVTKRIKSLLVPYLIWNAIIFFVYLAVQTFVPSMASGRTKMIADYTWTDYISSFWSMSYVYDGGMNGPINSPLWFVRDLIVMCIMSPLIYFLLKRLKAIIPIALVLLFISHVWDGVPGLSVSALAFFTLGAYLGMNKIKFAEQSLKLLPYTLGCYILLLIFLLTIELPTWFNFGRLGVVIGIVMSCGIAAWACSMGRKTNKFLAGSTFFIFASHCELLKVFIRLTSRMGVHNDFFYCVMYFVCPFLTLVILLIIYKVLRNYMPRVATILSGGR